MFCGKGRRSTRFSGVMHDMRIETPEMHFTDHQIGQELNRIEKLILSLTAQMEELKQQLGHEKKRARLRELRAKRQKLEDQLQYAHYEEEYLTKILWGN